MESAQDPPSRAVAGRLEIRSNCPGPLRAALLRVAAPRYFTSGCRCFGVVQGGTGGLYAGRGSFPERLREGRASPVSR
jgi:hypothetical protein